VSQFSEEALGGTKSAPWRATLGGDGDVGDVRFCHGGTAGKYHLCDFRIVHYKPYIYIGAPSFMNTSINTYIDCIDYIYKYMEINDPNWGVKPY
jgi:hypothetical protein